MVDEARCIARVPDDTGFHFFQCRRKRGHGPSGKYCKQHAKWFIKFNITKKDEQDEEP